jgi:hypothetical protein
VSTLKGTLHFDGQDFSKKEIDAAYLYSQNHILEISAADLAGNKTQTPASITFATIPTIDSISQNVNRYAENNFITNWHTKMLLQIRLGVIQISLYLYNTAKVSPLPEKAKARVLENLSDSTNKKIESLISDINDKKQFASDIFDPAKGILADNLAKIRIE